MEATAAPRVKICCISSVEEARLAANCGASAVGFVSQMPSGAGVIDEALTAIDQNPSVADWRRRLYNERPLPSHAWEQGVSSIDRRLPTSTGSQRGMTMSTFTLEMQLPEALRELGFGD